MKTALLIFALAFTAQAKADVFTEYKAVGTEALAMAQNPATPVADTVAKIQTLVGLGYQIMDLYIVKYPECTEQYAQLKSFDAEIQTQTYDQIDELYHAGSGLKPAPRVCYRGRSMVVHPYQVAALAKEGRLTTDAEAVDHEMNEVIHRADVIKTDLGL